MTPPLDIDAIAARAAAADHLTLIDKLEPERGNHTFAAEYLRESLAREDALLAALREARTYRASERTLVENTLSDLCFVLGAQDNPVLVVDVVDTAKRIVAERGTALAHVAELEADVEAVGRDLDNAERWRARFMAERDTALSSLADAQTFAKFQKDKIDGLRAAGEEARAFVREFVDDHNDWDQRALLVRARALLAKETT